jgi:hypothetical protein
MSKLWDGISTCAMLLLALPCASSAQGQDMGPEHMKHAAQSCGAASHENQAGDSAFAALQARAKVGMGVDQCASTHAFESTTYGGRVVYQMNSEDVAGAAQIRKHLRHIATSFSKGDFTTPEFIHAGRVPGTEVMARKQGSITYTARDIPRGAELRVATKDGEALKAVHEFMAFQRKEHRTGGKAM